MSDANQKDFEDKLERTKEIAQAVDEAINSKQSTIKIETENIEKLSKIGNDCKFVIELYSSGKKEVVESFTDNEYNRFIIPINDMLVSGSAIDQINYESQQAEQVAPLHMPIVAATGSTMSTAATNAQTISLELSDFFCKRDEIIKEYEPIDNFVHDVEYIRGELPNINRDVADDFEYLINKFNAFQTSASDYQELIGARSTFFFRLIFDFATTNYGGSTRKEQISRFVFGSATPDPTVEAIINNAREMYRELSDQDPSTGISAKEGKITPLYAEVTFRRLISIMSSLLRFRQRYFQR